MGLALVAVGNATVQAQPKLLTPLKLLALLVFC